MGDFERELLDLLEKNGKFDSAREELLRLQVTSEFDRKRKRLLIWAWAYHAIGLAIALPGFLMAFGNYDLRTTIQGAALIVAATAALTVIKLWYWIVHGRLEIMRELKRLELRLTVESKGAEPHQPAAS